MTSVVSLHEGRRSTSLCVKPIYKNETSSDRENRYDNIWNTFSKQVAPFIGNTVGDKNKCTDGESIDEV